MSATVRDITNGLVLLILLAISANEGLFTRIKANRAFANEANAEKGLVLVKGVSGYEGN